MLDFLRKIAGAPQAPRPEPGAEEAVAALLVEAARSDADYTPAEAAAIERFLAHMFGLTAEAASSARAKGEAAQRDAADLVRFTRVLKGEMDQAERGRLMEALWRVVLSDAVRDPHEDALMRKLAPLLALSDRESAEARRRAEGEGG